MIFLLLTAVVIALVVAATLFGLAIMGIAAYDRRQR